MPGKRKASTRCGWRQRRYSSKRATRPRALTLLEINGSAGAGVVDARELVELPGKYVSEHESSPDEVLSHVDERLWSMGVQTQEIKESSEA